MLLQDPEKYNVLSGVVHCSQQQADGGMAMVKTMLMITNKIMRFKILRCIILSMILITIDHKLIG